MQSFYWFDFETFGANPSRDRPSQFAGLRTDINFNPIDEPLVIYCQPADDFLPVPEACLVTGITPQQAKEEGVSERDFFRQIHLQLTQPATCAVGYNNIRFDDEVIRFGLYRNFYDAYSREWQDGNSRWDIIDLMRMTHALRPEGIQWPTKEDGSPSFRLEQLTVANGVAHENAHDALADVEATIAMAKLVCEKQPKLFQYLLQLRDKKRVQAAIDFVRHQPFVHVSAMLGPEHHYCGVMLPLAEHPTNKNSIICLDLTKPMEDLAELSADDISYRVFTRGDQLEAGIERLPIKEVHINKCPAVAPVGVLDIETQERLGIDLEDCLQNAEYLKTQLPSFLPVLQQAYQEHQFEPIQNPDFSLYSGGFFDQHDKRLMHRIQTTPFDKLVQAFDFHDQRLAEMLFRYRARNAPNSLNDEEQQKWQQYRNETLKSDAPKAGVSVTEFDSALAQLEQQATANDKKILAELAKYKAQIIASLENV